jgi:hypothetical protein
MRKLLLLLLPPAAVIVGCTGTKPAGDDTAAEECEGLVYADADGDGYGDDATEAAGCVADGLVEQGGDCDDGDPGINPGATELCDDVDNNCDGAIDEGAKLTLYADSDGDGFGDASSTTEACEAGEGVSTDNTDCDDTRGDVYPGAEEICGDGALNDCGGDAVAAFEQCGLGGDIGAGDAAVLIEGAAEDGLGWAVAGAGDVDGDGLDDVLVGAPFAGPGEASLHLGADLSGGDAGGTTYVGVADDDQVGFALDGAGDIDGDGYGDLVLGAPGETTSGVEAGAAYFISGATAAGGALSGAAVLLAEDQYHYLGESVSGAGDLDGDGVDDFLLGAGGADPELANSGATYVVTGVPSGSDEVWEIAWVIAGDVSNGASGAAVAGAGDTDGDGISDVVIGAFGDGAGGNFAGAAYLVRGPVKGDLSLADADAKLTGVSTINYAGAAVAGAGDVDGDGREDLLIGAYGAGDTGTFTGAAYVVNGDVTGTLSLTDAEATLTGEGATHYAGSAVAGIGDVNFDGKADILVGADLADIDGVSNCGAAYLLLGGTLSGTLSLADAQARFLGGSAESYVGAGVAGAGDVNGDGADDLLIGADGIGAAYLLLGGGL